jgi:hypothetical protein
MTALSRQKLKCRRVKNCVTFPSCAFSRLFRAKKSNLVAAKLVFQISRLETHVKRRVQPHKERPLFVPLVCDLNKNVFFALDVLLLLFPENERLFAHLDGKLLARADLSREEDGGKGALPDDLAELKVLWGLLATLHRTLFAARRQA